MFRRIRLKHFEPIELNYRNIGMVHVKKMTSCSKETMYFHHENQTFYNECVNMTLYSMIIIAVY